MNVIGPVLRTVQQRLPLNALLVSMGLLSAGAAMAAQPQQPTLVPGAPLAEDTAAGNINPRADSLLSVDVNRRDIVSRLLTQWQSEVPEAQRDSLKRMLTGLRADRLLAATLVGSFESLLEVVQSQEGATRGMASIATARSGEQKALGDANIDVVYTPVTPCRLFDTRVGQPSALGTLGGSFTPNSGRNIVPSGACGIPGTGVKSLLISFTTLNNTPSSGGYISMLAPAAPVTTTSDIFNNGQQWSASVTAVPTGTAGQFVVYVSGANAEVVVDVVGFFAPVTSGNVVASTSGNVFTVTNNSTVGGSAALRGASTSTGGGGIGVYGSHAGSGYGVYGSAATSGYGVIGQAGAGGVGTYGSSSGTGTGLYGVGAAPGWGVYSSGPIGTNNVIDFGSQTRQMINLYGGANSYGIGIQSGTVYNRVDAGAGNTTGFAWFRGGTHSDTAFSAGTGGLTVMTLSRDGQLVMPQALQQQIRLGDQAAGGDVMGIGAQNYTTYVRTPSAGGFAWYRNGTHVTTEANPGTGGEVLGGLYKAGDGSFLATATVTGQLRINTVVQTSDRAAKTSFAPVNAKAILAAVAAMPVSSWIYKHEGSAGVRHIGPVAQDFAKAFKVGYDNKTIATVDADGVALAAIKGLNQIVQEKNAEIATLKREMAAIKKKLGM